MSTREDSNIRSAVLLPSPATLRLEYPLPPAVAAGIDGHRRRLQDILTGADQRLLVMVGPCSIHPGFPENITMPPRRGWRPPSPVSSPWMACRRGP